jgi:hypothetical protein
MMNLLHNLPRMRVKTKLEQDQTLVVRTEHHDDDVSALNRSLRNSQLLRPGRNQAPIHPEGANIIYWFQADAGAWSAHKKRYPHLHKALHSKDQILREKAAAVIAEQHPEWLVCAPKVRMVGAR